MFKGVCVSETTSMCLFEFNQTQTLGYFKFKKFVVFFSSLLFVLLFYVEITIVE